VIFCLWGKTVKRARLSFWALIGPYPFQCRYKVIHVEIQAFEIGKEATQNLPAASADISIALYISTIRMKRMSNAKRVSMIGAIIFLVIALTPAARTVAYAADAFYNGGAGATGVRELPLFVAKDFKIFDKYGLDVELISTNGGSPLVQALVGGSLQSASLAAMAPIRAINSGANLAIVAGFLNKNMYSFVTRQNIQNASDLKGKTIGIASFGAANEFSALMALKALGIGSNAVNLRVAGGSLARLTGIEHGGIDATVVPHSNNAVAIGRGMRVFADLAKLVKEFPDGTVVMKRNLSPRERAVSKRFLQALSEAIYRLKTEPAMRETIVASMQKRMRVNRKYAEEIYEEYNEVFSYPPRVGRMDYKTFWRSWPGKRISLRQNSK
jgi:NitT/TauT family transport system substrate-binding protein